MLGKYADLAKLLAFALICGFFYWVGGVRVERSCLKADNKELKAALVDNAKANDERRKAQAKADKLAAWPPKVIERVAANPSGCSLAKPVADGLRDQVRQTNDAIRTVP